MGDRGDEFVLHRIEFCAFTEVSSRLRGLAGQVIEAGLQRRTLTLLFVQRHPKASGDEQQRCDYDCTDQSHRTVTNSNASNVYWVCNEGY